MNKETLKKIKAIGFSRIPIIHDVENKWVIGILMAKSLIGVDPSDLTLRDLYVSEEIDIKLPLYLSEKSQLTTVMKQFRKGYSHLAIVCKDE
jgi:CBS domain containing-hemolysin-like protein